MIKNIIFLIVFEEVYMIYMYYYFIIFMEGWTFWAILNKIL